MDASAAWPAPAHAPYEQHEGEDAEMQHSGSSSRRSSSSGSSGCDDALVVDDDAEAVAEAAAEAAAAGARPATLCTDECHLCAPADDPANALWVHFPAPALLALPDEILMAILARLSCKDLCQARKVRAAEREQ